MKPCSTKKRKVFLTAMKAGTAGVRTVMPIGQTREVSKDQPGILSLAHVQLQGDSCRSVLTKSCMRHELYRVDMVI